MKQTYVDRWLYFLYHIYLSITQGSEERKYPTAKPIKLLERLIEITTDEGDYVYDPMCGSGTFLIEAALSAFNVPPRILRSAYAFKNWQNFDNKLWDKITKEEDAKIKYLDIKLYGSDHISNNIKKFLKKKLKLNKYKIFLSLSDEKKHSIAYVIINKETWLKNL